MLRNSWPSWTIVPSGRLVGYRSISPTASAASQFGLLRASIFSVLRNLRGESTTVSVTLPPVFAYDMRHEAPAQSPVMPQTPVLRQPSATLADPCGGVNGVIRSVEH